MIRVGDIVFGTHFPETVEVKKVESFGDEYFSVAATGRESHTYYERMLDHQEIEPLTKVTNKSISNEEIDARDIQHILQYYSLQVDQKYLKGGH